MTTLQELLAQQAALEREITNQRAGSRASAIAEIRALMAAHGLTSADVAPASAHRARSDSALAGRKVAPKYRDPATGATWSGRGMKPKWVEAALASGKSLQDIAV